MMMMVVPLQEEWPEEVESRSRPEVLFSVMNVNKAAFTGSFTVTLFHQVETRSMKTYWREELARTHKD